MRVTRTLFLFSGLYLSLFVFLFAGLQARAEVAELPSPTGEVLLTVTGPIAVANDGDSALFDLQMLMDMDSHDFITTTIWTEGEQSFSGVTLQTLMARLGVTEGTLRARAINDYAVNIPFQDAEDGSALIAYLRNGQTMSVRDKGPLWVIYPFDDDFRFRSETYHARSIWQLDRIEILP